MKEKHAYLIMAHADINLLSSLLMCLDNERNDIYIHLDKKSAIKIEDIKSKCKKSEIYFTDRISVNWGGYSQINAEILLLEAALQRDGYLYYHFLSGSDLPLKTQDEIHQFFDEHAGMQFISVGECNHAEDFMARVKYYYPFQDYFGKYSIIGRILKRILLMLQKILKINRLHYKTYGVGSAYFDITDEFARYLLAQKDDIEKNFKYTFCADEMFLQTIYLNSEGFNRYINQNLEHAYIQPTYLNVLRAIDWVRGEPYTYREEDFEMLINSGCLFARKFNSSVDEKIIKRIVAHIDCNKK